MNIAETTAPKSDQQNYDDYIGGPKTVTVSEVKAGSAEQPVEIHLTEFPGRPFKPSKSMRRVLVACWGSDSSAYVGKRMKLFGDPEVKFGGQAVGGIRIGALSGLEKPVTVSLTVTRGKRAPFVVQPLTSPQKPQQDTSGRDWLADLEIADDDASAVSALGNAAIASHADPAIIATIRGVHRSLTSGQVQA